MSIRINRTQWQWISRLSWVVVLAALSTGSMPAAAGQTQPFPDGSFLTLMGGYVSALGGDVELGDGYGAVVGAGYRRGHYAIEGNAVFSSLSASGDSDTKLKGGVVSGLLFPVQRLPGLYLSVGAGSLQVQDYPTHPGGSFSSTTVQGSLGHIWRLNRGRYAFGIRSELGYRKGRREARINAARQDIDAPRRLTDALVHVGLHLPLSFMPPSPPKPVERPVQVVEAQALDDPAEARSPDSVDSPVSEEQAPWRSTDQEERDIDDQLDFLLQSDD